jgi:hypothetical protein
MTPCGSYKNRRFGGSYRLHLQGVRVRAGTERSGKLLYRQQLVCNYAKRATCKQSRKFGTGFISRDISGWVLLTHRNIWYPSTRLVFFPLPCRSVWLHSTHNALHKIPLLKPTPCSSNLGLFTRCSLGVVSYELLPIQELTTSLCACSQSYTLKMEAIRSSETSVLIRATRRNVPEDDNHHSHRRGNLKSYKSAKRFIRTVTNLPMGLP